MNKIIKDNLYGRVLLIKTLLQIFSLNNVRKTHNSRITDYKLILFYNPIYSLFYGVFVKYCIFRLYFKILIA